MSQVLPHVPALDLSMISMMLVPSDLNTNFYNHARKIFQEFPIRIYLKTSTNSAHMLNRTKEKL